MSEPLLDVRELRIAAGARTIVAGIDLRLAAGETLGIVGESGSGKSLTARAIAGVLPDGVTAHGAVRLRGHELLGRSERELSRVRGTGIAMVFQDPFAMLHPLMRCGAQVVELLRDGEGRRLSRRARRGEAARRLGEVGIRDPAVADAYPFQLSGGMRQRVGIAAALARDPELLIADEPTTALDATTQREILLRLRELQAARGMGLILITHDLRVAFSTCDRIEVLYAGSILERGPAPELEAAPAHPYTLGLLLSEPPGDRRLAALTAIPGAVPTADAVADRCAFEPRCAWARAPCALGPARLGAGRADGHASACVRIGEIAPALAAARRAGLAAAGAGDVAVVPAAAVTPLIRVDALRRAFGPGRAPALDGLALELAAGESVGLVGESGSGKTTLARCLVGLERPDAGHIAIDGIDASDWARLAPADRHRLRATIQIVFQDPAATLNPVRTAGATLAEALLAHRRGLRDVRTHVAALLAQVGLSAAHASRKPAALSGGERQRVAIARALAAQPRVLVCDEPVSALDVSVQAQIVNLLAGLRRELGLAILFITHDLAVARQVTDRLYVLAAGAVVEHGATDAVLDHPRHPATRALVAAVPTSDGAWLAPTNRQPAAASGGRLASDAECVDTEPR